MEITLWVVPFPHLLFHYRLAWSGWGYGQVIHGGESFVALSEGLPLFSQHQQGRHLRHGLLLALQLLLEGFDLSLVLGVEPFKLLLLLRLGKLAGLRLQGEHWRLIGILSRLPPAAHLLREEAPLTAVGAEFGFIQASRLHHHRSLQPPRLPPVVEGHHVNAQLL